MIEVRGVDLIYQAGDAPVQALSAVDLTIERGAFVSLIGPSGCGKTTLLRAIAGLEAPTAGTIALDGMSPDQARMNRRYGYVFQAPGLFPWRTIERNVCVPLEVMGLPRDEQRKRAAAALAQIGLGDFAHKFPWQLSGGMQQRASIARALCFDADILLMDEPFGALDEIVRDRLNAELLDLWKRSQRTVMFVTHSIPEAAFLSTRIVVMSARPGRISEIIDSPLPPDRPLSIRDSAEFAALTARLRAALQAGHVGSV